MRVESERITRLSDGGGDPLIGRTVAGFRIDEPLGQGGMGVVYKATQLSLNRTVAIKVLPESFGEKPQFLERFQREVDILSRLSHPNIVTVLERGEIDGRPWLAMEFVNGTTLREVVKKGPLPRHEALAIVRSVLSALEHAHDAGIIHRDVKPENVLLAPGGVVKVADFGLSRLLVTEGDTTRLTHTHIMLGTYEYMSPEQREKAKEADERSDIYATGVVLYEMIAGELPIGRFDPLSVKRPEECDRRIDEVVERSLEKDPDRRYQRASEMGAAVSGLLTAAPAGTAPAPVAAPAPAWKRVVSGIFGEEYPVAAIDRKLPRRFAERVIEDHVAQRWLAGHVALWPTFPAGIAFHVRAGRVVLELEGPRRDDPVRDKRFAALVGALLEANSEGRCRRIAIADPEFEREKATDLAQAPRIGDPEPVRPSRIPAQSRVVGDEALVPPGVKRASRGLAWGVFGIVVAGGFAILTAPMRGLPFGMIAITSIVAIFAIVVWVVRAAARAPRRPARQGRAEWPLGLAVTVLWVGIVLIATHGQLRDEHVVWLCVGAVASVFLVPQIPRLFKRVGGALVWIVVLGFVGMALLAGLFLTARVSDAEGELTASRAAVAEQLEAAARGHQAPAPDSSRPAEPPRVLDAGAPAPERGFRIAIATADFDLPEDFGQRLLGDLAVRAWLIANVESADLLLRDGARVVVEDGRTLRLVVSDPLRNTLAESMRGEETAGDGAIDRVRERMIDFGVAVALAARAFGPGSIERTVTGSREFEGKMDRVYPPEVEPLATPLPETLRYAVARVTGELPADVERRLREDTAIWAWLPKTIESWQFVPPPEAVALERNGEQLYVAFEPEWASGRLLAAWRMSGGSMERARAMYDAHAETVAVAIASALEVRFPGALTRTRNAPEGLRYKLEHTPFEDK